ncbi:MAG: hypothetical protein M0Q27_03450, partial [Candidatus Colwellbacteria bacterium]|nr:hypothetical protein [Candidatus Colwellbacteria bacterium]
IFLSNLQSTGPLTPEDIQSILDRLPEKARQCADNMSAVIELTQDLINEVSMKEEGYAKANVERYWHLRRFRMREAAKKPQYIQETVESRSQWKERVGGKDPVLIEDCFNAFCETMEITSEYVGMASPIRRANLILSDRKIQETIRRKGYLDYLRDMKDLLQRVQNRHVDTMWMESWYGAMTRNVTRAIFGFNLRLSAQQYFSILLTMAKVSPRHFTALRGLPSRALISRIEQWSPYLRERFMGAIGRELGDVARTGSVMRFLTGHDQVINLGTHWVRYFDKMAICDAWRVCEAEVRSRPKYQGRPSQELFLDREYRREVTQRAEEVIRATQPTWDVLDRSIIGAHRNPVARSLTMFHSQREKMVQMLGLANSEFMNRLEAIRRSRNLASLTEALETADGRRALGQLAKEYGVVMFNIAAVKGWAVLYSAMVLGREEDWEDWAISVLADIPGLFYLGDPMKEAISAWGRWARGKRVYQLGKISVPTLRVMETARLAMYEWGKLLMMTTEMADVSLDEQEAQFQRTMEITWEALQYMFGLPFLHITSITQSMKNREE